MIYTEHEIQQIHANIEKITAFLHDAAAKLGDRLDLTFDRQNRYSIVISCYGDTPHVNGWIGCNYVIPFKRNTEQTGRSIFDENDKILDFCVAIFREWTNIKTALQKEIERQSDTRALIANFEI